MTTERRLPVLLMVLVLAIVAYFSTGCTMGGDEPKTPTQPTSAAQRSLVFCLAAADLKPQPVRDTERQECFRKFEVPHGLRTY